MSNADTLKMVVELAKSEEVREEIRNIIAAVQSFGPDIKSVFEPITDSYVDLKTRAFKRYLDNGFTREEAMTLIIDAGSRVEQALGKAGKK